MNMKHEMFTLALAAAAATTHADAPSYCSVLFACLTLTTAELHAAIGV
jgi:hypothetical protein